MPIVIRAHEDYSGPDMNQIFISYMDLMDPTSRRKEYLEKHYYFSCQCLRCTKWDTFEAEMFTIKCSSCNENNEVDENSQGYTCPCLRVP